MIHLDTNYLIGLLMKGSPQAVEVDGWLAAGESLATSAIAWTEFLNGPVGPIEVSRADGPERGCVVLDQPQHILNFHGLSPGSRAAAGLRHSCVPQNENCCGVRALMFK